MLLQFTHGGVAACYDVFQAVIDLFLCPAQALNILRPFKIARGNPSGVCEDVWDDRDPSFVQDFVGWGSVGALAASMMAFAWTFCATIGREHSAERRRNEDVRRHHENLLVGNVRNTVGRRIAQADGASARNPLTRYVKAFGDCDPARGIAYRNDLCAQSMRKHRNEPADVAEALDRDLSTFKRRAAVFEELFSHKDDSSACRSLAAFAAMEVERLAGDSRR